MVMVFRELLDPREGKARKEILDNQVSQVHLEKMAFMDLLDLPDLKVKRENLDFKEHLELEEYLDLKVLKAILVLQDSPETLVNKDLVV